MATSTTGREIVNVGKKVLITAWTSGSGSTSAQTPVTMSQITANGKSFTFPFRPIPITQEGYGPEMSEVERPYNIPILDVKSGKLQKISFEAPLSVQFDGITKPIDDSVLGLTQMAEDAIPVRFTNMVEQVSKSSWYIAELGISQDRTLASGPSLRVTARFSLVEFKPIKTRFVYLQPFAYGVPAKGARTTVDKSVTTAEQLSSVSKRVSLETIGNTGSPRPMLSNVGD
jgi:hypothetical protein